MTSGQSRPLVIATNLDPEQEARLRAHWSAPIVLPGAPGRPVWEVPEEADLLFTYARGWSAAPPTPPAGWPGRLRWIQVAAAGVDAFPPWALSGRPVTCGRGIAARNIAEYVVAAILLREKGLGGAPLASPEDWRPWPVGTLAGRVVGLLGLGAIAEAVVPRLAPFSVRLLGLRRSPGAPAEQPVELVRSLHELFAIADHLVVALPLTVETRHILDARAFAAAKPGLHVINVSRGPLIDHAALLAALDAGQVGAATLDVTEPEPLPAGHRLYAHPSVRLTPHLSWASADYADLLAAKLHENLDRFLAGRPLLDLVEPGRGY